MRMLRSAGRQRADLCRPQGRRASRRARFPAPRGALVNNMVKGVSEGFERRLQLQGVGYRAQAQGKKLNLQLGFSHPVEYNSSRTV